MSNDLPEGWVWAKIGELVAPSKEKIEPSQCADSPYLSLEHIESHTARIASSGKGADVGSTKAVFHAGDVLYGKLRPYLNKVCMPDFDGICSTDILVFPNSPSLQNRFFMRFLMQPEVVEYANHNSNGIQLPRISFDKLAQLPLKLPPFAEQQRIVAKVEALLARVNAARQRLAKVPAILRRFRQSVLGTACSGRLTAEWRKEDLEAERIPISWRQLELEKLLSEPLANGRSVVDATDSGFPVLRLTALKGRRIDLTERKMGDWSFKDAKPFLVTRGDFLVGRGNGSLRLVGRGGLVSQEPDQVAYPDTLIRVRPNKSLLQPEYLAVVWDAPTTREQIEEAAHTTAGIHKVSQKDLRCIRLAIPPLPEQREIVRRVDNLFKLSDAIGNRLAAATARAEKLTQAILAKAFRGELVPTEAELARKEGRDYEPASVLLERIRAERASQTGESNQKPKRQRKQHAQSNR